MQHHGCGNLRAQSSLVAGGTEVCLSGSILVLLTWLIPALAGPMGVSKME